MTRRNDTAQKSVLVILPRSYGTTDEAAQALYEALMEAAATQKEEWEQRQSRKTHIPPES